MLPQMCPSEKEAVGWYDNCMLRYANRAILGINDQLPTLMLYNLINVTDNVNQFNQVLGNLLHKLQNKAASGDSQLKFATGSDKGDSFKNIYALAQCSPDLSHRNCFNCVGNFISNVLPSCCANSIGAQVLGPSCKIRYEDYLFYNIPASPPPQSGNGSNTLELAILIIVATVISVALAVGFIYLYRSKKSLEKCESKQNSVFPFRFSNMFNWGNDNIQYIVNHQIFNLWFQWLHLYFINLKMMKAEA
ncbi:hypothetical protein BVRB_8g186760 [Beta vulgaris subsp. vulgaris]|nr:hypothetical protein BVRB_8g186760 [Beta vulgaris subsp. vulgaris]